MSTRNAYHCGWCGVLTAPTESTQLANQAPSSPLGTQQVVRCAHCLNFSLRVGKARGDGVIHFTYYPPESDPSLTVDTTHVPDPIADDYREAIKAYRAGAYKAAATMARRAVQGTCIDLISKLPTEITDEHPDLDLDKLRKASPYEQIETLRDLHELTNRLVKLAHKVRILGNAGAHPGEDLDETVTPEASAEAIRFVRHLFEHVYILGEDETAAKDPSQT